MSETESAGERRSVVFVVAHPDDLAFGMGGTAWLLKDKYKLHVLCLTKGERGLKGQSHSETAAIREKEEAAACALLGAELTFLGQMDGEIYAHPEICQRVAEILKELDPVAVFSLWPINVPDHAATGQIASKAMNLAGIYFTSELYYSEVSLGGQGNQFDPDIYVNTSDVMEEKFKLARCHVCQNVDDRSVKGMITRDRVRGLLARCEYAEAYKTPWPLMGTRWDRKSTCILWDL
jgi:LmbE family N-acetylglucosaminyl deacetylase